MGSSAFIGLNPPAPSGVGANLPGVQIEHPEPKIVCDRCRKSSADDERAAEAGGWVIDHSITPRAHLCPDCQRTSLGA
jgi:hypothetical protein